MHYQDMRNPASTLHPASVSVDCSLLVAPSVADTVESVGQRRGASQPPALQPLGQYDAHEIRTGDHDPGGERYQAVEDGAGVDVPAHALPLDVALCRGQRRRGEPPDAEAQRQGVPDHQPPRVRPFHVCQRARAVRRGAVENPRIVEVAVVLRGAVQEHVHVRADVHVAELERPGQRKDQRDILGDVVLAAHGLGVRRRSLGEAAGQRGVAVDVELEEVEERIRHHVNRAILLALDAVVELERLARLVADGKGDPLDLVRRVLDVLARLATKASELAQGRGTQRYHARTTGSVSQASRSCRTKGKGPRGAYELLFMHSTFMGAP